MFSNLSSMRGTLNGSSFRLGSALTGGGSTAATTSTNGGGASSGNLSLSNLSLSNRSSSSPHSTFIHDELLPLVIKLQKESRGRKYREVQATLQEAVLALHSFANEEWPPPPTTTTAAAAADDDDKKNDDVTSATTTTTTTTNIATKNAALASSSSRKKVDDNNEEDQQQELEEEIAKEKVSLPPTMPTPTEDAAAAACTIEEEADKEEDEEAEQAHHQKNDHDGVVGAVATTDDDEEKRNDDLLPSDEQQQQATSNNNKINDDDDDVSVLTLDTNLNAMSVNDQQQQQQQPEGGGGGGGGGDGVTSSPPVQVEEALAPISDDATVSATPTSSKARISGGGGGPTTTPTTTSSSLSSSKRQQQQPPQSTFATPASSRRRPAPQQQQQGRVLMGGVVIIEPVHESIEKTMEAFIAILAHPAKVTKVLEIAFDGIDLIVTSGNRLRYFSGQAGGYDDLSGSGSGGGVSATAPEQDGNNTHTRPPPASLLHRILEAIGKCSESGSEIIHAALIKTLRNITISNRCSIHENSMLMVLRTIFHTYLITKSQTKPIKQQAKIALLDMLRLVFGRMEAYDAVLLTSKSNHENSSRSAGDTHSTTAGTKTTTLHNQDGISSDGSTTISSTTGTVVTTGSSSIDYNVSNGNNNNNNNNSSSNNSSYSAFRSQYHADSYTLFRALCKLSSKELPVDHQEEPPTTRLFASSSSTSSSSSSHYNHHNEMTDPLTLSSKILSLELILAAINYCGDVFIHHHHNNSGYGFGGGGGGGDRFILLIQQYLCVSLLKNCVSNHTQVAYLSQKIFLVLVHKFKNVLKQEIEIFMSNIFFRVLDSPNSSFQQKALVLESLRALCNDPILITQIFLNYDCDFTSMNLYKDIVHMLTKLGGRSTIVFATMNNNTHSHHTSSSTKKKLMEQDFELSLAAIEVLVAILKAFLRALNLPFGDSTRISNNNDPNNNNSGSNNNDVDDSAGARIRGMLQLDVGLATIITTADDHHRHQHDAMNNGVDTSVSSTNDDFATATTSIIAASSTNSPQTPLHRSNNNNDDIDNNNTSPPSIVEAATTVGSATKMPTTTANVVEDTIVAASSNSGAEGGTSSSSFIPSSTEATTNTNTKNIVDAFEMKRNAEQNFEMGAVKFTLNIKSGLKFFIDNGFVTCDASSIAYFFINNKDKLDKTQMGEVLGREMDAAFIKGQPDIDSEKGGPGFFVRILHHYIYALDFTNLLFDEAIRLFLSGFRLPGEAQKIDRIMEKFAEHYTTQNPTIFPSADTAFILAFSVIMLNTDLHNPSIKPERRMTLESFIRNNRGIGDNGADLPEEFLRGIFDRIKERPFSLKEDDVARERAAAAGTGGFGQKQASSSFDFFDGASFFGTSAEERKRDKFKKERDEMMAATEILIRRRPEKGGANNNNSNHNNGSTTNNNNNNNNPIIVVRDTDSVSPSDVVKPMFDVTWGPMIGILSQVLECTDDERTTAVCLNGFVYAVRVASHSNMSLARDTFITSLAKFTFLGSIKEMKRKNVECIRTLLSIAVIDGEYLGESWSSVLQCISQLARLRLSASGLDSDESLLGSKDNNKEQQQQTTNGSAGTSSSSGGGIGVKRTISGRGGGGTSKVVSTSAFSRQQQPSRDEIAKEAEENNGRAVLEAVQEVLIDKVFSSSVNLSAKSLAHFIEELIAVSSAEIAGNTKRGITGVESAISVVSAVAANPTSGAASMIGSGSSHGSTGEGLSIFSLQRLVEVADYNMSVRPRIVWAQLWEQMADHFTKLACHEKTMVSYFAIDSLKQLSLKFLDKPELIEFHYQRIFLKPFLHVIQDVGSTEEIRELVLRCIDNIIRTRSYNLRSGWKIIFAILNHSAIDPRTSKIEYLGLAILQRLLDEHLDELCNNHNNNHHYNNNNNNSRKGGGGEQQQVIVESGDPTTPTLPGAEQQQQATTTSTTTTNERRTTRNANADDFVGLCRASLAFIQTDEMDSVRPVGSSMRAICHAAIYADLIAARRVSPPISDEQSKDPGSPGYTYEGLVGQDALEMVLWRPLFEGLALGLRSTAKTSASGVGCLVQRASALALRAILLRHGRLFSCSQLAAILEQTLLPAIQTAAENDRSTVVDITSESPSVSNIDFLVDSLPVPPPPDDPALLRFGELARHSRSLGKAELMLEASFTDLRHGGDGDLRRAHVLAKKAASADKATSEQPFPDSWLATTASVSLGLLLDLVSDIIVHLGHDGRVELWPRIAKQCKLWYVGRRGTTANHGGTNIDSQWSPCEALVRIASREVTRLPHRMRHSFDDDSSEERDQWMFLVWNLFNEMLFESVQVEEWTRRRLLQSKKKKTGKVNGGDGSVLRTQYGRGRIAELRTDSYDTTDSTRLEITVQIVTLDFGATLFQPLAEAPTEKAKDDGVTDTFWEEAVPALKVRCVAAHCLHQGLIEIAKSIPVGNEGLVSMLYDTLDSSRRVAGPAVGDKVVSTAFQASLLDDWGDGDDSLQSSARLSLLHGSATFFLTQEAGATRAIIHLLSLMYLSSPDDTGWNKIEYAEQRLLQIMNEVVGKYLESEARDGPLVDPSVWRYSSENRGKVALYCTSFAPVIVDILKVIRSARAIQFARNKHIFFPAVCKLIRSQSDEIRKAVQDILAEQVAPILGVDVVLR